MKLLDKIKFNLRLKVVGLFKKRSYYSKLYKSYWHQCLFKRGKASLDINYYTAQPHPGAGIGHQMANWIAGYWFANKFQLQFVHTPFSSKTWEDFLGFGANEITVAELKTNGYLKVKLPLFNEFNPVEVNLTKRIIESYQNQQVVFIAEQDQGYRDQFGVVQAIKQKFYNAPARKKDQFIYDKASFNIAIHVRRGDIVIGQENKNPNLLLRWQGNDYFEKVLNKVVNTLKTDKPIVIYLFSQGEQKDFSAFDKFSNLHFCLDMNAQDSFLHMVFADLLITSKSSFSYKSALLSNGIKICPEDFWHGYPNTKDWVLVNNDGEFEATDLINTIR